MPGKFPEHDFYQSLSSVYHISLRIQDGAGTLLERFSPYHEEDEVLFTVARCSERLLLLCKQSQKPQVISSEMWVRINTRRKGEGHAFENSLEQLRIAAELNMPVNPELLCVRNYMDMGTQDTAGFEEYSEIALPRRWDACSLDEVCAAFQQYGAIVAKEILSTGCRVNIWDIGNETNFGFGGVNVGIKSAVNPKLEKAKPIWIYPRPHMGAAWLAENVWKHNAKMMAAVAAGVRTVDPRAKFSAHIATAIADTAYTVKYFSTLMKNGFSPDEAGISFYPSVPGPSRNQMKKLKNIVSAIHRSCGLKVFIAEYAYPSKPMTEGQFKGWNWKAKGFDFTEEDQSRLLQEIISWGKMNGLSGIRPFAPDLNDGWEPMSLFNYDRQQKVSTAKKALLDLR